MTELQINQTEEIISFNKLSLTFQVDETTDKVDCLVTVMSLTDSWVILRTKTTKKDLYAVNPSYVSIAPHSSADINFSYFAKKDVSKNPSSHKFKYEAIISDQNVDSSKVKPFFENVIKSGKPVQGQTKKMGVQFVLSSSQEIPKVSSVVSSSKFAQEELSESQIFDQVKSKECPHANKPLNKQCEQKLQELKIEYYKHKNNLNNVVESYNNLEKRLESEKSRKTSGGPGFTVNLSQVQSVEKQIPVKMAVVFCLLSVFIGYFLSR